MEAPPRARAGWEPRAPARSLSPVFGGHTERGTVSSDEQSSLTTHAKAWPEVERHYSALAAAGKWRVDAVLEVVRTLRSESWACRGHPSTSHEVLCLARDPVFEWGRDMLCVVQAEDHLKVSHATRRAGGEAGVVAVIGARVTAREALGLIQSWASRG